MRYVFYNPDTLIIKGMSTEPTSMELPYLETEGNYHSCENMSLKKVKGEVQLKIKKGTFKST